MNLDDKSQFVEEIRGRFAASPLIILADFKGITVKDLNKVRRTCEKQGVHFQVVKNTLCVRAIRGTPKENLADHFTGNIAVLFSTEDPIATAKMLKDQLKEAEKLVVKAAWFEGDVIDAKGVDAVAGLPSKEQLLATLLGTLQSGPQQLVGVIQAPARDLLFVLQAYAQKLEASGEGA